MSAPLVYLSTRIGTVCRPSGASYEYDFALSSVVATKTLSFTLAGLTPPWVLTATDETPSGTTPITVTGGLSPLPVCVIAIRPSVTSEAGPHATLATDDPG